MRNKITTLLVFVFIFGYGQEKAITESGDTIYIHSDGTWTFDKEKVDIVMPNSTTFDFQKQKVLIDSTFRNFTVPKQSIKVINKEDDFFSINYNETEWKRVPPATINPAASYTFSDEKEGIFAMVIAEKIEMGTENIFKFALKNAEQNTGSPPKVINAELVSVNNSEMINAIYDLELNGLKFTFNSLFFSSSNGTIQFMTWSFSNVFNEKKEKLDGILSGLKIKQ